MNNYWTIIDPHKNDRPLAIVRATTDLQAVLKVERVAVWDLWWRVRESTQDEKVTFSSFPMICLTKIPGPPLLSVLRTAVTCLPLQRLPRLVYGLRQRPNSE